MIATMPSGNTILKAVIGSSPPTLGFDYLATLALRTRCQRQRRDRNGSGEYAVRCDDLHFVAI
jgi:hypothetical protein